MKTMIRLRGMIRYKNEEKTIMRNKLVVVDPDDTIYSVMAQMEEVTGVPPILQMFTFHGKSFYHDTPGTLAENKLVPTYPSPVSVEDSDRHTWDTLDMLRKDTLRNLGFCVDDDLLPDASAIRQLIHSHGQKMMISLTDYIRKDGAGRKMMLVVKPGDTVASLKEQVQRRRRYPLAMMELKVSDADSPNVEIRLMDKLDATLADYNVKRGSLIHLYMSMAFAIQADREERGRSEIAAPGEQQQRRPTRTVGEMKMQIFVRHILPGEKIKTLYVDPDDTVYNVMAQIEEMTGVPPILQRLDTPCYKRFYYDTPGTLADNKLVDTRYPGHTVSVALTRGCTRCWNRLQRKTLRNLGFNADDNKDVGDPSDLWLYPGQKKMFITVTDHIRMDGGERQMVLVVSPEDTVASLMERVQRRRRYPVAMQRLMVRDVDRPWYMDRRMDELDATLADYNVREDSPIKLYMDMEFAFQAHRESIKAKEINAPGEQQKLADDEK